MVGHEIELRYERDDGNHRGIVFAPDPERGCWTLRELRRDQETAPWETVGVETVRDVALRCTPVEAPESMQGP